MRQVCAFCGAKKGTTREASYPYGHRAPDGKPCRGKPSIRIVESSAAPRHLKTSQQDEESDYA